MKYLDPKADLTFKKIFGNHPKRLISLLNALLPLSEEEQIQEIKYLPTELVPENNSYRYAIANILCTDAKSNKFCVVIRMEWSNFFEHRVQFIASELYVNPAIKQVKYFAQYPTYSLNLINDTYKYNTPDFIHNYHVVYDKDTHKVIEDLHFTFIELPKFTPHSITDKRMMVLWLRFLTEINEETKEVPADLLDEPEIGQAIKELEVFDFTEVELRVYDKFWDSVSVERTLLDDSYQQGMEKGMENGMEKGMEKGMKKGMEEGMNQRSLEIARNLLSLGLPVTQITQATGLTEEEIRQMKL